MLLWMAEGLLEQKSQKQMEDVGHEYFQELLSASLFQKSSSNRSLYVMHDLINDLAQWVAGESCFKLDNNFQSHKQKKKKISNQRMGESKKEGSSWSKKPEEMCREVFGPDNI